MEVILNSLGKPIPKITYKDGSPVVLNSMELALAHSLERKANAEVKNALGFEVPITTMTAIHKTMVDQKFYEFDITKYVPIEVGNAAFNTSVLTYRSFYSGGDFESGLINSGTGISRTAQADARFDAISVPIQSWKDGVAWNLIELKQASANNQLIDLLTQKQKASKKMWDLGIQAAAFFGLKSNTAVRGLLNQTGVTSNTALITKTISSMSDSEFATLVQGLMTAYVANASYTSVPNTFLIPSADYYGLASFSNVNFNVKTKLQVLVEMFKTMTSNDNFQVLPLAYGMQANNSTITGLNKNRYVLMNMDADVIRMDIPVPFTNTLANTLNNFDYQSVAYGQFTGAQAYRPLEILYLDY
jgi:hypothetical protein